MIEKWFAAAMVAVCVVLLLRQFVGERRRDRFDAATRRVVRRLRRAVDDVRRRLRAPAEHRRAARVADDLIRRARGDTRARGHGTRRGPVEDVEREGNVYKPKSFRNDKGDTLH